MLPLLLCYCQDDCQYSGLWAAILYPQMSYDLCRIVPEWSVSLPTYWGVLIQWGGAYLGFTVRPASSCPMPHVSYVTLSLSGRMQWCVMGQPPSKSALSMCCAAHPPPPQLLQEGWRAVSPSGSRLVRGVNRAQQAHWELCSLECSWGREVLSTPQDLPSTGMPPAGLALCATLPVTLSVSQEAPQTTRPVHPSGVQSWAGGSCRSLDPQTPSAATW